MSLLFYVLEAGTWLGIACVGVGAGLLIGPVDWETEEASVLTEEVRSTPGISFSDAIVWTNRLTSSLAELWSGICMIAFLMLNILVTCSFAVSEKRCLVSRSAVGYRFTMLSASALIFVSS